MTIRNSIIEDFGLTQDNKRFVGTSTHNNVADPNHCMNQCKDQADCVAWSSTKNWATNNCFKYTSVTSVEDDSVYKSAVKSCPSSDGDFEIPCYIKLEDDTLLTTGNILITICYHA